MSDASSLLLWCRNRENEWHSSLPFSYKNCFVSLGAVTCSQFTCMYMKRRGIRLLPRDELLLVACVHVCVCEGATCVCLCVPLTEFYGRFNSLRIRITFLMSDILTCLSEHEFYRQMRATLPANSIKISLFFLPPSFSCCYI